MITTAANTIPRYSCKEQRKWVRGQSAWKPSSLSKLITWHLSAPSQTQRYLQPLNILNTKVVHKLVLLTQHKGSCLFISLCGSTPKHIKLTYWNSRAYGKSFWTECLKEVNLPWAQKAAQPAFWGKTDSFTYVVVVGLLLHQALYAVSQKTQNSTNPEQERESSEELPTELYPFRSGGWGGEGIWAITSQDLSCTCRSQTLQERLLFRHCGKTQLHKVGLNLLKFYHSNTELLTENRDVQSCQGSTIQVQDVRAECQNRS